MSNSSYSHRHTSDRYHRSDRSHHDYRPRDRDSRDSRRNDHSLQRRVPGLVSDPDTQLGDADLAIRRGQRETINRYQSDRYSPPKSSKPTKDTMSSEYKRAVITVSQPYYPTSTRNSYTYKKSRLPPINAGFLAFLPGLAGFALLITAIVLVEWYVTTIITTKTNLVNVNHIGLFQVCSRSFTLGTATSSTPQSCRTLEQFTSAGTSISDLEQATRAMVIIAAIIAFAAIVVSFVFGLHVWQRSKGAIIAGGLLALAGVCGVAGMGCFSAVLTNTINSATTNNLSTVTAGTSFYLGWVGTGCLLIASVISFLGHCARRK